MAIAVQVEPRDARPQLAELPGQERLTGVVIELFLVMRVVDRGADVDEPSLGRECRGIRPAGLRRRSRARGGFVDLVAAVGLDVFYDASPPAAPGHFQPQSLRRAADGKDAHRIVPGQIASAADDLLLLAGNGAAEESDLGSDALDIGGLAVKTHG